MSLTKQGNPNPLSLDSEPQKKNHTHWPVFEGKPPTLGLRPVFRASQKRVHFLTPTWALPQLASLNGSHVFQTKSWQLPRNRLARARPVVSASNAPRPTDAAADLSPAPRKLGPFSELTSSASSAFMASTSMPRFAFRTPGNCARAGRRRGSEQMPKVAP